MSVQTEIDRIITAVGAAYDAVEEKGGTLPTSETVANLAEAINSIPAVSTEAKTVELSMPSGDQTVSPSAGKFLSAVTVKKPATMLPENIKKGVTIGGVVGTLESGGGSTSETWVLNNKADDTVVSFDCNFVSNGESFSGLSVEKTFGNMRSLIYGQDQVAVIDYIAGGTNVWAWEADAYRKLIFSVPPTGDLLTWLTANGVKQPANLAVQPSKDVTITSNGTTEVTPDAPYDVMEKANVTVNVPTGGGDIDALIERTIQEVTSDVSKVGSDAFSHCTALTTASFPQATSIGERAFYFCGILAAASVPQATSIGANAFYSCTHLKTAIYPQVANIGDSAFNGCSALATASFPEATYIGKGICYNCISLSTVNFPKATKIGDNAFYGCTSLVTVELPEATSIPVRSFYKCSNIATASFSKATYIGTNAFASCSKLTALVLGNTERVCTLASTNVLTGTPIAAGTGYIYVPDALVDSYKNTSVWNAYAAQIKPMSEYSA